MIYRGCATQRAITLRAPYPYPGGKSAAAAAIWARFGDAPNYVEPFAGSAAVLLARPHDLDGKTETINDSDGHITNALRSIAYAPEETAYWCDWPVSEIDLTARHLHLKARRDEMTATLFADPRACYPQAAGWWLWGAASWIGDGWCVDDGPWINVDGRLVDRRTIGSEEEGVPKQMPEVGAKAIGGDNSHTYRGVLRYRSDPPAALLAYFVRLSERLRRVRILCGDWRRVVRPSITINHGLTALLLDPPYPAAEHDTAYHGGSDIWRDVARWAMEHGDDSRLRIALCGYHSAATDALVPATWERYHWTTNGGYGNQSKDGRGRANAKRECIWFSPSCLDPSKDYGPLFEELR